MSKQTPPKETPAEQTPTEENTPENNNNAKTSNGSSGSGDECEDMELRKKPNGLIKTDIENLQRIFDSKEFYDLFVDGKVNVEDPRKTIRRTSFLSQEEEKACRETAEANNKPWPPSFMASTMNITSVNINDKGGFIEFQAWEFPLDTLKTLATTCKGGMEIIWLNPEKEKFTHTEISEEGKSIFKEHGLSELEDLFEDKPNTKRSKEDKKDKKDKGIDFFEL